jgi:hypothetical protein
MRPGASSVPVQRRVVRGYYFNRMARDCQARAYEQALPNAGHTPLPFVAECSTEGDPAAGERADRPPLFASPSLASAEVAA